MKTPEQKAVEAERSRRWRARHPERAREVKRRYYASEKGKASKRREDAAYVASGGRAATEARRAAKGVSPARAAVRRKWAHENTEYLAAKQALRRAGEKGLGELDVFVLREAMHLSRLREQRLGGRWNVDHIVPVSRGGRSTHDNLQVVPALWNRRKSNRHTERFFGATMKEA